MKGTDPAVVRTKAISMGMNRFLNLYVIGACKKTEKMREKMYARRGTDAIANDVPS